MKSLYTFILLVFAKEEVFDGDADLGDSMDGDAGNEDAGTLFFDV